MEEKNGPGFSVSTNNKKMPLSQQTRSDTLKTKFVPIFMNSVTNASGQRILKYKLKRIKMVIHEERPNQN